MAVSSNGSVTRAYDYRLPREIQKDCLRTLGLVLPIENDLLESLWSESFLEQLGLTCDTKYVWKWLEPRMERPEGLPSRIWRGILEQVGRTLKAQAVRLDLFRFLKSITTNEQEWCWQLCRDNGKPFVKANHIYSIKEAVCRYRCKNAGKFPERYFDITGCPRLRNGIITYAPDDGQAIRYDLEGTTFKVRLKVIDEEGTWTWRETSFELPGIVLERLGDGTMRSPDLRCKDGKAFLDLKVESKNSGARDNCPRNKLFADWGTTRKLLAIIAVTPGGAQMGPPIFLKYEGVFGKLHRIRQHIDHLKKARAKVARRKDRRRWDRYTALIGQAWSKYHELQKELAHLASNALVDIAEAYGCDAIYVEDLSTCKSKNFSRKLNRIINNTVRSQIYNKVAYKGKLKGLSLHYVKAWWTSQTCPLTGVRGKRFTAPDGIRRAGGGWFISEACSLDADYVACKNLARRALFDFSLNRAKALAYKERATLAKQFRQGTGGLRNLRKALSGWNYGVKIVPGSVFYPLRA